MLNQLPPELVSNINEYLCTHDYSNFILVSRYVYRVLNNAPDRLLRKLVLKRKMNPHLYEAEMLDLCIDKTRWYMNLTAWAFRLKPFLCVDCENQGLSHATELYATYHTEYLTDQEREVAGLQPGIIDLDPNWYNPRVLLSEAEREKEYYDNLVEWSMQEDYPDQNID